MDSPTSKRIKHTSHTINEDAHSKDVISVYNKTSSRRDGHQNPNMKESEWGKVMISTSHNNSKSEKSNNSSSITSGESAESTESVTPENSTDSNNNSDDGLSIEPSNNSSNADLQTLSSRVPIPAFIKSTRDSNCLGDFFISRDDNKLIALQNVLSECGVEIADNSPSAVLAATYDYLIQLRSSSQQFEDKIKQLQVALDKHDDVVCQAILKNVQIDVLQKEQLTTNASTVLAAGTVDKDLYFIDASEELLELLCPTHSSDQIETKTASKEFDVTHMNLLTLVEDEYRDCLKAKLSLLSINDYNQSFSSSERGGCCEQDINISDSDKSSAEEASAIINPLYIYVTSNILTPNHSLGKRKRPCVLRITALATTSPSSLTSAARTPQYSVTIYSA